MKKDTRADIVKNMDLIKELGIGQLSTQDDCFEGRKITFNDQEVVQFAFCDYLGLSIDERIKEAGVDALNKYGLYNAVSRSYVSVGLYEEMEELASKIFNRPTIMFQRTTLLHPAVLPILVDKNDAVILDHQVHTSVQVACQLLKAKGCKVELMRHNNLERLEDRINKLSKNYDKIWYMVDGIYSMYGDMMPAKELHEMLDQHEKLHLYVDDAHGMSWMGERGSGFLMDSVDMHPKLFLATSFGKGFGSGGAAFVCHDEEMRAVIKSLAYTYIFTSPVPPPILGAGIAAAKIHLSDEIYDLQKKLQERITFTNKKSKELGLPLAMEAQTPIFYFGIPHSEIGSKVATALVANGYYLCPCGYPAVPENNSGIRGTITVHHTLEDIEGMLTVMSNSLNAVLEEHDMTMEELKSRFVMKME